MRQRFAKPLWILLVCAAVCPWPAVLEHASAQQAQPPLPPELLSYRRLSVFYIAKDLDSALQPVARADAEPQAALPGRPRVLPAEVHATGRVDGAVVRLTFTVDVVAGPAGALCVLGLGNAVLEGARAAVGQGLAVLWHEQLGYLLELPGPGRYQVQLQAVLPALRLNQGGALRLALPGAPVTGIALDLPAGTSFVQILPDRPHRLEQRDGSGARLTVAAGSVRELLVRWADSPPQSPRVARFVVSQSRVWANDRAVTLQSELRLTAAEPVASWQIELPAGARFISAEPVGEARFDRILNTEKGRTTLRLEAIDSRFSHAELRLELQFPFDREGRSRVVGVTVADAAEHTGWVVLQLDVDSQLGVTATEHLVPRDPADYPGELPQDGPLYVWRVGGAPFALELQRFAVAGPVRATVDVAALAEEASTAVAARFTLRANKPLEAVEVALPRDVAGLQLATQEMVHAVPPVELDTTGHYPERVTIRSPRRSSTTFSFTLTYRVPHVTAGPSAPRTVPLPALLGAQPERVRVLIAATDAPAWLVAPEARETHADFDGATALLALLQQQARVIVRAYELVAPRLPQLTIQKGSPALSYHGDAQVNITLVDGRLRVEQALRYTPPDVLLRGLELLVPAPLEHSIRWPEQLRVQPLGNGRYLVQPTVASDQPGTGSVRWQFDLAVPEDGPLSLPLVVPDNLPVTWTELLAELPASLRLRVADAGWHEAGLEARDDAATIRWRWYRPENVPTQAKLTIERIGAALGYGWFADRVLYRVAFEPPDGLRWRCSWRFTRLRTSEVTLRVPSGATVVEVTVDGKPAAWGAVAQNQYRVQIPQARGSARLLSVAMVQRLDRPLGLVRNLSLTPPNLSGSGILGETLWELRLPPLLHPLLGGTNYVPLVTFRLSAAPGWFTAALGPDELAAWIGQGHDQDAAKAPTPVPRAVLYAPANGGPLRLAVVALALLALVAALAAFLITTLMFLLPKQLAQATGALTLAGLLLLAWWDLPTAVLVIQYGIVGGLIAVAAALVRRRLELERVRRELFRPAVPPSSSVARDSRAAAEVASEVR